MKSFACILFPLFFIGIVACQEKAPKNDDPENTLIIEGILYFTKTEKKVLNCKNLSIEQEHNSFTMEAIDLKDGTKMSLKERDLPPYGPHGRPTQISIIGEYVRGGIRKPIPDLKSFFPDLRIPQEGAYVWMPVACPSDDTVLIGFWAGGNCKGCEQWGLVKFDQTGKIIESENATDAIVIDYIEASRSNH